MHTKARNVIALSSSAKKSSTGGVMATLRSLWRSLSADADYQCRYQTLRNQGMPHAMAVKQAMASRKDAQGLA